MVLDVTEISAILAAAGVLVGVIYYVLDIRNQAKVRRTELVMRLYSAFGDPDFVEAWELIRKKGSMDFEAYEKEYGLSAYLQVGTLFEGLGILLDRRLIDINLAYDLFSVPARLAWERMKVLIEEDRKQANEPKTYEWFEYLYREMEKREQKLQQSNA